MSARAAAAAAAAFAGLIAGPAFACSGAGVITRIEGKPQEVVIHRTGVNGSANVRPRVLDAVCAGDRVEVLGTTKVQLSLDGAGSVPVTAGKPYTVAGRAGAPSLGGNAYRMLMEVVMPDMKRLAWDVRLRGEVTPFGLAAPVQQGAALAPGRQSVFLRLVGGEGPYSAELKTVAGAQVGSGSSQTRDLVLKTAALQPGAHKLTLRDAAGTVVEHELTVEAPPAVSNLSDVSDPEVRAALGAVELAKLDPGKWTLEAEQLLAAAPAGGMDRERVYQLIETYGAD